MSSWTLLISGACTRHAYKPLFENLPACTREGDKFRVFTRLFDLNHRKFEHFPSDCALSGRILEANGEGHGTLCHVPDAPGDALSFPAGESRTLSQFLQESHRRSLTLGRVRGRLVGLSARADLGGGERASLVSRREVRERPSFHGRRCESVPGWVLGVWVKCGRAPTVWLGLST
jgi:hypothetical protein